MIKVIYLEVVDSLKNLLNAIFDKKIETPRKKHREFNALEKKLDSHLELYHTSIVEKIKNSKSKFLIYI